MNRTTTRLATRIAAALTILGASTLALADGATYEYPTTVNSTTTRAAVLADAQVAQRAGLNVAGEATHERPAVVSSQTTRARVVAEAAEAQRLGLTVDGEQSPVATPAQERAIQLAGERATSMQVASTVSR